MQELTANSTGSSVRKFDTRCIPRGKAVESVDKSRSASLLLLVKARTTFPTLTLIGGRGSEKAFNECLGVSNVFPSLFRGKLKQSDPACPQGQLLTSTVTHHVVLEILCDPVPRYHSLASFLCQSNDAHRASSWGGKKPC